MSLSTCRVYMNLKNGDVTYLDYNLLYTSVTFKWISIVNDALEKAAPFTNVILQLESPKNHLDEMEHELQIELKNLEHLIRAPSKDFHNQALNALLVILHNLIYSFKLNASSQKLQNGARRAYYLAQTLNNWRITHPLSLPMERYVSFDLLKAPQFFLSEEDFSWFSGETLFGDLIVTPPRPKGLKECFITDDQTTIRGGALVRSPFLESGVTLAFPEKNPKPGSSEKLKELTKEWLLKNNLDASDQMFEPAKLGELKDTRAPEEINSMLSQVASLNRLELL